MVNYNHKNKIIIYLYNKNIINNKIINIYQNILNHIKIINKKIFNKKLNLLKINLIKVKILIILTINFKLSTKIKPRNTVLPILRIESIKIKIKMRKISKN
jgi:hypothetical protein